MEIKLHYDVLNNKRFSIVKELQTFKNRFYLAGGTGLALQIGHRVSEDFDFFSIGPFKNDRIDSELHKLFPTHTNLSTKIFHPLSIQITSILPVFLR
jgi:hypothetical protein